ncbi:MAG: Amuc_1102 family pilus-like protein [Verrucomicrobiia bacterium]
MSNRTVLATLSVSVAFLIPAVLSFAQEPQAPASPSFRIRAVRQRLVSPPDYRSIVSGAGGRSVSAGQNWLQIETEFESSPDWADDVQLKYYVLLGRGENAHALVGEITYVNVAKGPQHYSAMFVHPNTLQRYGKGQVEAVAVQLFYKGQLIDQSSYPPSDDHWWERATPVSGLVLPPRETPWSVLAFDRYESPKPTP